MNRALISLFAMMLVLPCGCGKPSAAPLPRPEAKPLSLDSEEEMKPGKNFRGGQNLTNVPVVVSRHFAPQKGFCATVKNTGNTTLVYTATSDEAHIREHWVVLLESGETSAGYDYCGNGKEEYRLSPGEVRELIVPGHGPCRDFRVFGEFREDGTERSGGIELARKSDLTNVR